MILVHYPKCSTCQKAKAFLINKGCTFEQRDIKEDNPTKEELILWHKKSLLPLKHFFNTSGLIYKELNLKDTIATLSEDEQFDILSTNGMLVKRPILLLDSTVLVGFKENIWDMHV